MQKNSEDSFLPYPPCTVNSGYSHTKCLLEKCDSNQSVTICGAAKNRGISDRES